MTYTAKFYRIAHVAISCADRKTASIRMWMGYAFVLPKNRAWQAVLVAVASFLAIPVVLTIITLLIP